MNTSISVFAEIPEDLHDSLKTYLEKHPNWDLDRVFSAALSLFLLQNEGNFGAAGVGQRPCARVYLETLFRHQD
ncbi:MAG: DUF2811 domain-containing protein [Cyanobacteriota bacterium]|jgi:hypothetical protein